MEQPASRTFKKYLEASKGWCNSKEDTAELRRSYWFQSWDHHRANTSAEHKRSEQFLEDDVDTPFFLRSLSYDGGGTYGYGEEDHAFYHGVCGTGSQGNRTDDGAVWDAAVFGQRLWRIHPPSLAGSYQCVQHAGDVLVVPGLWSTSVLHRQESVGVSVRFNLVGSGGGGVHDEV